MAGAMPWLLIVSCAARAASSSIFALGRCGLVRSQIARQIPEVAPCLDGQPTNSPRSARRTNWKPPRPNETALSSPRTVWVVPYGDDLYVRSVNRPTAAWFPGTQVRHEGHIRAGGEECHFHHSRPRPRRPDRRRVPSQVPPVCAGFYRRRHHRSGPVDNHPARAAARRVLAMPGWCYDTLASVSVMLPVPPASGATMIV